MPRAAAGTYELAYEILGDGSPTLVFHWGMLGDRQEFREIAERLPGTRILVDGRGYGASDAPDDAHSLEQYADDLAGFLRTVLDGPAILVGQSMGAMTFLRLAMAHPDLVEALVLCNTSAGPEDSEKLPLYEALLAVVAQDGPSRDLLEAAARVSLMTESFLASDDPRLERWFERMLTLDPDAFVAHGRAIFDRVDITPRLGEITAPTLVVAGGQDAATPPERARTLASGLGGPAELVELDGASHFVAAEEPERVADVIRDWLDRR